MNGSEHKIMNRNLSLYIDLIFCFVLLPVMTMLLPVERWLSHHPFFVIMLALWLYAVYFITRKAVIPLIFVKKKYWAAVLIFLAMTVLTYFLSKYDLSPRGDNFFRFPPPRQRGGGFFRARMHEQAVWFLYFVVSVFSIAVGLLTQLYRQSAEKKEIEAEKNKAELALYKAQINPHFMFNTLNTLYGLVITKSDRAEPAFNRFISMMKYMYTNGVKDFIPLGEEAEYIGQYIELQKERLNEHTKVTFDHAADGENYRIAPMLLITFVENAFKYGVSSHVDTEITIRLTASDGKIAFFVSNSVMKTGDGQGKEGIGITNCRKRLALLYPGKHELKISRPDGRFVVELTIDEKGESDETQFIESHSNR